MKERKKVVGRRVPCNWKGKYLSKDKKYMVEFVPSMTVCFKLNHVLLIF